MNNAGISQEKDVNQAIIERIVKEIVNRLPVSGAKEASTEPVVPQKHGMSSNPHKIPVGVSVRHVHICREDMDILFGRGSELHPMRDLYQPGSFAAKETVSLVGPKMRMLERVRILGPMRAKTQVELAKTDAIFLGIDAPVRMSGDIKGSAPITIVGPKGMVPLKEGCIRAMRHIHMNKREAEDFNMKQGDKVKLRVGGPTAVTFENVIIRVDENVYLEVHLDTDEGNVADIHCNQEVEIIKNGDFRASII